MAQRMSGMESLWPGHVTQVIDPHYFWMQLGTRESLTRFEKLQRDMQEYGRLNFKSLTEADPLEYGHVVLVDTGDSGALRFKRGQVARITSGNSVDIFYVDYGNTELTTRDKIMSYMPDVFKTCMPQAVRCSLAGVRPISKNWTIRGTRTFQTATAGPLLYTLVLRGEPGYCEVSLYLSDSDEARSISHLLLDEEVAMIKDGEEVPEHVRDIPDFMASYMTRAYSDKQKPVDGHQLSPKQEPVTIETSHNLQPPGHAASPATSPPSTSRTSDKYIPPNRKYQEKSPHSPGSQFDGSPKSHSSVSSSPGQGSLGLAKPATQPTVVDFFPFDTVSTYPPTPVSPVKSPGRGTWGQETSYFSRSPSKYDHLEQQAYRGYQTNGQHYRGRGGDVYYTESTDRGYHRNGSEKNYRKPADQNHHHHDRSRFAANFDNLPRDHAEDGLPEKASIAAANLEPHYLNKKPERNGQHNSGDGSHKSPVSGPVRYASSPSRPIQYPAHATPPFYPPNLSGDVEPDVQSPVHLTTPQYYHAKGGPPEAYNKHSKDLMPPGFYQSHKSSSPGDGYPYKGQHQYSSGDAGAYSPGNKQYSDYGYKYKDAENGSTTQRSKHQYYNQEEEKPRYYDDPHANYDHPIVPGSYNHPTNRNNDVPKTRPGNENNSNTKVHPARPHVKMPSRSDVYSNPRMSGETSPESPAIAAFNLSDIEHTEFASADMFHQRMHQEKLQALQEEVEDIAVESQEQSRLAEMARYGGLNIGEGQVFQHPVDHEAFDQISEDISTASRENEELKNSPIKHFREPPLPDRPAKLEGMPPSYMADIDFTEAVKQALEFVKTDGVENARALLDSVVESLRSARVEKQLFDVLLMLLSKAIQDYELCHEVVMDTISRLNNEMEIKEALSKALKRQQERCVQVPVRKNPHHQHFARIMGALYNLALDWSDSNATVQDSILVTVEKWILFNNKGSQIGQNDKENVFLDCFVAFWEVSGSQLLQHNNSFRTRLQEEVKQKLLHEKVSRSIRERLLEILLESFMGGSNVPVVMEEAFTQTPRKTMIPSSCQVKPAAREKSTMTEPAWTDDPSGYDADDSRWFSATDFASPEVSLNLRPMGQRSKVTQLSSTPDDASKSHKGKPGGSLHNPADQDQSYASSTAEYVTPNTSLVLDKAACNSSSTGATCSVQNKPSGTVLQQREVCDSVQAKHDHKLNSPISPAGARPSQGARGSAGERERGTVCETKGASGKTIVDWFDYQPDSPTSNRSAKAAATKPGTPENLKHVKKGLESLSLDNIEEKYSVIAKGKSCAEAIGNSSKSKKKDKKAGKGSPASNKVVESSPASNKAVESSPASNKAVESNPASNKVEENRPPRNKVEGSSASEAKVAQVDASDSKVKEIELSEAKVAEVALSVGAAGAGYEAASAAEERDCVKDWWGVEEDRESRTRSLKQPKHGACEIHVDPSPDVIIEEEFMEDVNSQGSFKSPETVVSAEPSANEALEVGNSSVSQSSFSPVYDKKYTQSTDLSQNDSVSSAKKYDGGVKVTVNDTYGFSEDMSDENWDSDSAEEFNVEQAATNNDILAPSVEVNESRGAVGQSVSSVACVDTAQDEYDRKFPRTNLADYIRPVLGDSPSPEPVSRWKPKRRICLTCHDESHKTENCPKGIVLLQ